VRLVVLDAAAVVEYLLQTPSAPGIAQTVEDGSVDLHVPALCDVEVTAALRRAVLQRRLPPARADDALGDYLDLPLRRHGHAALLPRILALRDTFSAYDACYAALAERLGADLLTGDGALARAAATHLALRVEHP
jgi:predicted nucleic acid-binding protein